MRVLAKAMTKCQNEIFNIRFVLGLLLVSHLKQFMVVSFHPLSEFSTECQTYWEFPGNGSFQHPKVVGTTLRLTMDYG